MSNKVRKAHSLTGRITPELMLALSPEKTHVTTFKKGFYFLGFDISSRSVTIRDKFATSIRRLCKTSATTALRGNFRRSRPTP